MGTSASAPVDVLVPDLRARRLYRLHRPRPGERGNVKKFSWSEVRREVQRGSARGLLVGVVDIPLSDDPGWACIVLAIEHQNS